MLIVSASQNFRNERYEQKLQKPLLTTGVD